MTVSVKTLKRKLKKAGLKTTGKKSTLTRRAKKARLVRGGGHVCSNASGETTEHISQATCEGAGNTWKEIDPAVEAEGAEIIPEPEPEGGRRRRRH